MKIFHALCAIGLLLPPLALAQGVPRSASPASGLDVTKPQFDTVTPHYDVTAPTEKAAGTIVATVGDRTVTLGEVGDAIRALPATLQALPFDSVYPAVLTQLIQLQALAARAQRLGLDKDPTIQRKMKVAADRALTNELLLREAGGAITEKMLLARYDQDYAGKPGPEEVRSRVILVATQAEAEAILTELTGGADFVTVAKRASRDATAPNGGEIGFARREMLTPEVGAVAFALAAGQTAMRPVKTDTGWFIVRTEERRPGPTPGFASVRDAVRETLMRDAITAVARAALSEVNVHAFDISGKEMKAEAPKQP